MPRTLVSMALVVGLRPTLSSHLPLSVTLCLCAALTVGSTVPSSVDLTLLATCPLVQYLFYA